MVIDDKYYKSFKKTCDNLYLIQCQKLLKQEIEKEISNTITSFGFNPEQFDFEVLNPKPLDIDTQISNIKHQLKYEKNPLVIKNLNRKMNRLIKEKKNV